jgi:hypothetical protein|tara:strand:+ start:158 stop:751 length:594 start_codon:yes stop_codon:yes gene_type:complete
MIASCGGTTTVLLSSSSCCLRWFRKRTTTRVDPPPPFGFYPFLSSQKNSFHYSFQNVTKTRALFDGTSIIMLRAGVQTQMTTTINKVLSSCVCSTTTRPTWHRCGRHHHHHHHHHHHRARDGKTGLERRTMCTKAASSSNDTNNNKTTTPQEQWKASIDFKAIRENQKHVERNCANRNVAVDVSAGRNLMMTFLRDE